MTEKPPRTTPESLLGIFPVLEIIPPPDYFQNEESPSGVYISTPGARRFPPENVHEALRRFFQKDWGKLSSNYHSWISEQNRLNDHYIRTREGPVLACYDQDEPMGPIWIHLGRDAQHPTVMIPEER